MKQEIINLRIRKEDTEQRIKKLDFECKGLILVIRSTIDPYTPLQDLKSEEALHSIQRLHDLLTIRQELSTQLKEYKTALGAAHGY